MRHLPKGKLDAIVVASGGWNGDVEDDDLKRGEEEEEFVKESADVMEKMLRMNYYPVVAGSLVGQRFMDGNGEDLSIFVCRALELMNTLIAATLSSLTLDRK